MKCENCGRPIHLDKKKRAVHSDPIGYGKTQSILFCKDGTMIIAKKPE